MPAGVENYSRSQTYKLQTVTVVDLHCSEDDKAQNQAARIAENIT